MSEKTTGKKGFRERRRHRRFRLRQPTFVLFDSEPKLREILDVSMSGLAVAFIGDHPDALKRAHRLTIVRRIREYEPETALPDLACRIVSEEEMNAWPRSGFERRRFGVELVDLTPGQRQQLARFILAHAAREV